VARLVEPDLATARQADGCLDSPLGLLDLGTRDSLRRQRVSGGLQVVAHEVEDRAEDVVVRVTLDEGTRGGVNAQLGWGEPKDEPSSTGIDGGKPEYVTKELPVGLGVVAVEKEVSAGDHEIPI